MIQIKDIYNDSIVTIPNINQVSQWFYHHGITKNQENRNFLKQQMQKKKVVYQHYFLKEVSENE